jgi:TM2 domain-containing membrane protein YozV
MQRVEGQGKNKILAGLLALFLGGFGIHRFYLGQWWGLFYLLFVWTFIPSFIAFIESIVFFCASDAEWEKKYG